MKAAILILGTVMLAAAATDATGQGRILERQRPAWLGISYEPVVTAGRDVLVIRQVIDNAPAQRAGIQVGDTLVSVNGIHATPALMAGLGPSLAPGDTVRLRIRRAGRERDVTVVADARPADFVFLTPQAGVLQVDPDAMRVRVRDLIDSARVKLDSLRMPDVFIERGTGDRLRLRLDTLRGGLLRDTTFFIGPDSARGVVLRYFSSDSLRVEMDSLRLRLMREPMRFELMRDSTLARLRALPGTTVWSFGPDSVRSLMRTDPGPFGIAMWGQTAIAGAELTRVDPALGEYFGVDRGVLVVRVPRDTPAERSGLQAGDVILRANDTPVASVDELRRAIERTQPGRTARLEIMRRNQRTTVELRRD